MEIDFDWRGWIREGLLDEVTVKMGAMRGLIAPAAIMAAREAGLKVNACPYLNGLPRRPDGSEICASMARDALAAGVDGFIMYENAAFMAATDDGDVELTSPWMVDTLREPARERAEH
jgi:hypothetical protein